MACCRSDEKFDLRNIKSFAESDVYLSHQENIKNLRTGTVQTSAKARLTSAVIWRISVNECPLTIFRICQLVTNPKNNPCIPTVIRIATKI